MSVFGGCLETAGNERSGILNFLLIENCRKSRGRRFDHFNESKLIEEINYKIACVCIPACEWMCVLRGCHVPGPRGMIEGFVKALIAAVQRPKCVNIMFSCA